MKRFLGIVCLIYSSLILYVWLGGNLNNYIAPNMQIYIKGSIIPLVIIGIVVLINNKINYKFKISDVILLLPVLLIFFSGDGILSIDVAKVKATSKIRTKTDTNVVEPIEYDKQEKIDDFYFDIVDSNYSYLADYITYIQGAHKYVGKTIKAIGFAVDYSEYLTDDYFAFGRYMITCCAADAEFTGFMVKYPIDKIEYGKWYQVEGYLELGKDSEGYDIMTINPTSVKEINSDGIKNYVYSCDTYGKDACDDLQKYNLEY